MEVVRTGHDEDRADPAGLTAVALPLAAAFRIHTPPREVTGRRNLMLAWAIVAADLVTICCAYLLAKELRVDAWWNDFATLRRIDPVIVMTIPAWLLVFSVHGLYGRRRVTEGAGELLKLLQAISLSMVIVVLVAFLFRVEVSRGWIVVLWFAAIVLVTAERVAARALIYFLNSRRLLGFRTLIVGANEEGRALARTLRRKRYVGYEVIGFVGAGPSRVDDVPVVGTLDEIRRVVDFFDVGAVVAAGSALGTDGLAFLDRELHGSGVRVRVSLGLPHLAASRVLVEPVDGLALLSVERHQLTRQQMLLKRAFDVCLGAAMTLVLLPVMAVVAALVVIKTGRPILFKQTRIGADGRLFTIYKFRTMVRDAEKILGTLRDANEADGILFKMKRDPRITKIGARLRALALDELPQLFNVLKGDMSLVGPRPALPEEASSWPAELQARLRTKPGVTGLWQVSGRHELSFEDYMRYDLFYVENWSLTLDAMIVARTVPALLSRRGSY